jgi:hypothetical protein
MKIQSRKSWLPRDLVVMSLFIFGIVALATLMIAGISQNYGSNTLLSPSFQNNYNKLSSITSSVSSMSNASQGNQGGLSFIGTFNVIFAGTFTVISLLFGMVGLYTGTAASFVSDFTFLNAQVVQVFFIIVIGIMMTLLIFKWLSSVTRGKL